MSAAVLLLVCLGIAVLCAVPVQRRRVEAEAARIVAALRRGERPAGRHREAVRR